MRRRVILMLAAMTLTLVLASGVALAVNKVGTNGPDTLRGTNRDDNLSGRGGDDLLLGLRGADSLLGGPGKDVLIGGNERRFLGGDKNLVGGPGNDSVLAGKGSDNALGGKGNDLLIDGVARDERSEDNLSGGAGNDVIAVVHAPAFKDLVVCGAGFDRVSVDPEDVVAPDCERVVIIRSAAEEGAFFESIPPSFFAGLNPVTFE